MPRIDWKQIANPPTVTGGVLVWRSVWVAVAARTRYQFGHNLGGYPDSILVRGRVSGRSVQADILSNNLFNGSSYYGATFRHIDQDTIEVYTLDFPYHENSAQAATSCDYLISLARFT